MVGRQLSRYRIVEEVGSGGMSVVYRGLDTSLDREVAVKVLHPHLAGKEESRRRFSREARAVARLHHPHILEIYDFSGDESAESFIVTEFIRGQTLRRFAELHPLRPPEVAAMAVHELADALEHAHAIGVIHRDLKPENVMIRDDGCLKLTDFGIAKILDREDKMTMTGALVGSPAHMAPEIIEGAEAGPEADIFSLGTIFYWLCTRKLPFAAANTTATLKRVLDGLYDDPRSINPQIPDELNKMIARCLARDPGARYPSASALRDALAGSLGEVGIERPGEELAAFFADPEGAPTRLTARITARVLAQSRELIRAGRIPRAMAGLSRVLALDPQCAEAVGLLDSLKRRTRRVRSALLVLSCAAGLAVLAGGVWGTSRLWHGLQHASPQVAERTAPVQPPPPRPAAPAPPALPAALPLAPAPVEVRRRVELAPRVKKLARAEGEPGTVLIVPRPYADIYIDGTKVKSDALEYQARLPPGKHEVRLVHQNCVTATVSAQVPPGGRAPDIRVRLEPQPARLEVVNAQNAGVLVDGKLMGTASMSVQNPFLIAMPQDASGRQTYRAQVWVTLTKPGYRDVTLSKQLTAGELTSIAQELEAE